MFRTARSSLNTFQNFPFRSFPLLPNASLEIALLSIPIEKPPPAGSFLRSGCDVAVDRVTTVIPRSCLIPPHWMIGVFLSHFSTTAVFSFLYLFSRRHLHSKNSTLQKINLSSIFLFFPIQTKEQIRPLLPFSLSLPLAHSAFLSKFLHTIKTWKLGLRLSHHHHHLTVTITINSPSLSLSPSPHLHSHPSPTGNSHHDQHRSTTSSALTADKSQEASEEHSPSEELRSNQAGGRGRQGRQGDTLSILLLLRFGLLRGSERGKDRERRGERQMSGNVRS